MPPGSLGSAPGRAARRGAAPEPPAGACELAGAAVSRSPRTAGAAPCRTGPPPGRPARSRALPVRGVPGCAALRFPSTAVECSAATRSSPAASRSPRSAPASERRASRTHQRRRGHEGRGAFRQRGGVRARREQSCDPAAVAGAAEEPWDRQQRRGLLAQRAERGERLDAHLARAAAAVVAALRVARQPVLLGALVRAGRHRAIMVWPSPRSGVPRTALCTRSRAAGARGTARSPRPAASGRACLPISR